MALTVNSTLCPQNHRCPLLRVCPAGAITQAGNALPQVDPEKCAECGKCIKYCGMKAIYKQNV
ncbi:MAG: 4Fe-4S binding protein [Prevotellaceae bacterium]|nr:4Fe-4S binding protein [Prevotellaceae bacterium]